MKKLIFIKFNSDVLKFFFTSLLIMGSIVWIIQAINYFDFITEDGHGLRIYFIYTLLNFPKVIHRILPFMLFIAIFYTIVSYEYKNELNLFWINGITKFNFSNKLIFLSIIIMIFQIILGSIISPSFQFKSRDFLKSSNIDFFSSLIKEKKFINITKNFSIFIEKKNNDGSYSNIFVVDNTKKNSRTIIAKDGLLINSKKEKVFKLYKGKVINDSNSEINIFDFELIELNLNNLNSKTITTHKIQEIDTITLLSCFFKITKLNKEFSCNKKLNKEMKQELLKRIYKPIYIPVITLVCCFLLSFSKNISYYKKFNNFIFFLIFLIIIFSEASLRYSGNSTLTFIIYLLVPLFLFLTSYSLLYINKRYA